MWIQFGQKKEEQKLSEKWKKITSLDLDGVLNTYSGHKDYHPHRICPPREDTGDFLKRLAEKRTIEIYTVRDLRSVRKWAKEYGFAKLISGYTHLKNPFSSEIVDDRAVYFNGDYDQLFDDIINLNPHWKKTT